MSKKSILEGFEVARTVSEIKGKKNEYVGIDRDGVITLGAIAQEELGITEKTYATIHFDNANNKMAIEFGNKMVPSETLSCSSGKLNAKAKFKRTTNETVLKLIHPLTNCKPEERVKYAWEITRGEKTIPKIQSYVIMDTIHVQKLEYTPIIHKKEKVIVLELDNWANRIPVKTVPREVKGTYFRTEKKVIMENGKLK